MRLSRDPSDWFSPMLVKEMRQGMKARVFTGVFLTIQVAMVLCMFMAMLPTSSSEARTMSAVLFWSIASSLIIFAMPLRGVASLTSEIKERTFELVMLTRLTAWRIVMGKWASLVLQTTLITTTLLPFLVVRYFIGGVDLIVEVLLLGLMLVVSGWLSALAIFASSYKTWIGKVVLAGFQMWGIGILIAFIADGRGALADLSYAMNSVFMGAVLFVGTFVLSTLLILEFASARIAPMAENHALRKRGILLLFYLINLYCLTIDAEEVATVVMMVLASFVFIDAMCGPMADTPSIYVPFVRRGFFGKVLGRLFYPGWPTAVPFVLVLGIPILIQLVIVFDIDRPRDIAPIFLGYYISLFVPAVLYVLIRKGKAMYYYLGYFIVSGILSGFVVAVSALLHGDEDVVAFVPAAAFIAGCAEEIDRSLAVPISASLSLVLLWAVVTIAVRRVEAMRRIRIEEQKAEGIVIHEERGG